MVQKEDVQGFDGFNQPARGAMGYIRPFQFEHNGKVCTGTIEFGWVKLVRDGPKLDHRGRIIGWYSRITDSDGRNELLDPPEVLVYEKEWWEQLTMNGAKNEQETFTRNHRNYPAILPGSDC